MARGFGSTYGAGTTDSVATVLSSHATTRSYALWALIHGTGGGGFGRLFDKRTSGAQVELFYGDNIGLINYDRYWTTQGNWYISVPSSDVWHHYLVTYDGSSTANDPIIYVDGSPASITRYLAPTGSLVTNTDVYVLGNRLNDNARNFDGMLAEFAVWNAVLGAAEAAALAKGYSPMLIRPASLAEYVPMVRDNVSRLLAPPTIVGTAVQPHAPVIYPHRRFLSVPNVTPGPFPPFPQRVFYQPA